jgi:hypothetical protein
MLNGKKVNLLPLSSQQLENQLGSQQKKVKSLKGLLLAKNKKDIKQTLALAGAIYK